MSTRTEREQITSYGTSLLRTVVEEDDGHYLWTRRPGESAPAGFRALNPETIGVLEGAGRGTRTHMVVGTGDDSVRHYTVGYWESAAFGVLREGSGICPDLVEPLRGLGAALRTAHGATPAAEAGPPPGLLRVTDWLAGRSEDSVASHAAQLLSTRLGVENQRKLLSWCEEAIEDHSATLHGAPGLGALILSPETGRAEVLTGEDVSVGPAAWDIGWIVGELLEFQWRTGTESRDPAWRSLVTAVIDGYGSHPGAALDRMAILRITLHLHDFLTFVGWHEIEFAQTSDFLRFLADRT